MEWIYFLEAFNLKPHSQCYNNNNSRIQDTDEKEGKESKDRENEKEEEEGINTGDYENRRRRATTSYGIGVVCTEKEFACCTAESSQSSATLCDTQGSLNHQQQHRHAANKKLSKCTACIVCIANASHALCVPASLRRRPGTGYHN